MKLSIVVPAFRVERWQKFYDSIEDSFHGEWELILIGPYEPTFKKINMKWIKDWGYPTRCQQIGLLEAKGDYVTFSWDDAIYGHGALDNTWNIIEENKFNPKIAVISKFIEGETKMDWALTDDFSLITTHNDAKMPCIPSNYKVQNTGMTSRKEIMDIGGFDCRFQTMAFSVLDLGIRLQANGVKMIIQQGVVLQCTWDIGLEHKPVMDSFKIHDKPLYMHKYHESINIMVDVDNWKNTPTKWERRFGK